MALDFDPIITQEGDLFTLVNQRAVGTFPAAIEQYEIPASGNVLLKERPQQVSATIPTGVTVNKSGFGNFTEVLAAPGLNQFLVNYFDGTLTFNVGNATDVVTVSYNATGSVVKAEHVNNIAIPFMSIYQQVADAAPAVLPAPQNWVFPADVTVTGDLNVIGVVNKLASEVIDFTDDILLLNSGAPAGGGPDVGIAVDRGGSGNPSIQWLEADDSWNFLSTAGANLVKIENTGDTTIDGDLTVTGTISGSASLTVANYTNATEAVFVAGLTTPADDGIIWFNTDDNQFKGWNGNTGSAGYDGVVIVG